MTGPEGGKSSFLIKLGADSHQKGTKDVNYRFCLIKNTHTQHLVLQQEIA